MSAMVWSVCTPTVMVEPGSFSCPSRRGTPFPAPGDDGGCYVRHQLVGNYPRVFVPSGAQSVLYRVHLSLCVFAAALQSQDNHYGRLYLTLQWVFCILEINSICFSTLIGHILSRHLFPQLNLPTCSACKYIVIQFGGYIHFAYHRNRTRT